MGPCCPPCPPEQARRLAKEARPPSGWKTVTSTRSRLTQGHLGVARVRQSHCHVARVGARASHGWMCALPIRAALAALARACAKSWHLATLSTLLTGESHRGRGLPPTQHKPMRVAAARPGSPGMDVTHSSQATHPGGTERSEGALCAQADVPSHRAPQS